MIVIIDVVKGVCFVTITYYFIYDVVLLLLYVLYDCIMYCFMSDPRESSSANGDP